MNNLFLLNETLNTSSIAELEDGISNLNSILTEKNNLTDTLMKHTSVWDYNNGHGRIIDFYFSVVSKETQRLVPKFFESLSDYDNYITTKIEFDGYFPNDCNAFTGINFSTSPISSAHRVTDCISFKQFKNNCAIAIAYNSIQDFWDARSVLFPNLVFCDRVWEQINHLSVNDDRFRLMKDKLNRLNIYSKNWANSNSIFDIHAIGLDCSPDTPTRIKDTLSLRTFTCPNIRERVFNYHIKWYFSGEPFRLYFYPEAQNRTVYVGYIGAKSNIGF